MRNRVRDFALEIKQDSQVSLYLDIRRINGNRCLQLGNGEIGTFFIQKPTCLPDVLCQGTLLVCSGLGETNWGQTDQDREKPAHCVHLALIIGPRTVLPNFVLDLW